MVTSELKATQPETNFKYPCICRHVDDKDIVILFTHYKNGIVLRYQDSTLHPYTIGSSYNASSMKNFIPLLPSECIELRNV